MHAKVLLAAPITVTVAASSIVVGIANMHKEGILHNDIKPSNMLLHKTSGGKLIGRVADLGLAETLPCGDGATGTLSFAPGHAPGTVGYFAPESSKGNCSTKTDVYAFGVSLAEILTNKDDVYSSVAEWHQGVTTRGAFLQWVQVETVKAWDLDPGPPKGPAATAIAAAAATATGASAAATGAPAASKGPAASAAAAPPTAAGAGAPKGPTAPVKPWKPLVRSLAQLAVGCMEPSPNKRPRMQDAVTALQCTCRAGPLVRPL